METSCSHPAVKARPSLRCVLLNDSRKITYLLVKLPSVMPLSKHGNTENLANPWNIQLETECSEFCHDKFYIHCSDKLCSQ